MTIGYEMPIKHLPRYIISLLKEAGEIGERKGQSVYLVGGVVRDLFLRRDNLDLDLVIEGDALELANELAAKHGVKVLVHSRFGTAKLQFATFNLDVATARTETYAHPGALPTVKPGTIAEDLKRRDFSINAMALCLNPSRFGELFDPAGGKEDLAKGLVRVLHARSFIDDATRILRGIRYEQRLNFKLEAETEKLLRRDVKMLHTISGDRLRHELERTLQEDEPEKALSRAEELGVLRELHPSLKGNGWIREVFRKARQGRRRSSINLYLCLLCYPMTRQAAEEFLKRFNFSKRVIQGVSDTLRLKEDTERLADEGIKPSVIYELLCGYDNVAIEANLLATGSAVVREHLKLYLSRLRYVKPFLDGLDLVVLGVPAGPETGKALDALRRAKLDGVVRTRSDEEEFIHKHFLKPK